MPVERDVRGAEHDRPVEDGRDPPLASGHRAGPQLEMAAILVLPRLVQVDEQVQAPVEVQQRVPVEVDVHLEEPAGHDLMRPRAAEVRIGDQPANPGERLEELQHRGRAHLVEEALEVGAQRRLVPVAELLLRRVVESLPLDLVGAGKLRQHGLQGLLGEEAVDDDVRKRPRGQVLRVERPGIGVELHRGEYSGPVVQSRGARGHACGAAAGPGRSSDRARARRRGLGSLRPRPASLVDARRRLPPAVPAHPSRVLVRLRPVGPRRAAGPGPDPAPLPVDRPGPAPLRPRPASVLSPSPRGSVRLRRGALRCPPPLAGAALGGRRGVDLPDRARDRVARVHARGPPLRRDPRAGRALRGRLGRGPATVAGGGRVGARLPVRRVVLHGVHGQGDRGAARRSPPAPACAGCPAGRYPGAHPAGRATRRGVRHLSGASLRAAGHARHRIWLRRAAAGRARPRPGPARQDRGGIRGRAGVGGWGGLRAGAGGRGLDAARFQPPAPGRRSDRRRDAARHASGPARLDPDGAAIRPGGVGGHGGGIRARLRPVGHRGALDATPDGGRRHRGRSLRLGPVGEPAGLASSLRPGRADERGEPLRPGDERGGRLAPAARPGGHAGRARVDEGSGLPASPRRPLVPGRSAPLPAPWPPRASLGVRGRRPPHGGAHRADPAGARSILRVDPCRGAPGRELSGGRHGPLLGARSVSHGDVPVCPRGRWPGRRRAGPRRIPDAPVAGAARAADRLRIPGGLGHVLARAPPPPRRRLERALVPSLTATGPPPGWIIPSTPSSAP